MSAVRKPTKKPAPPPYRSSAPVCDCGSGIPRSETAEIPSSGGRRGCEKCYNRKYAAYADSDGSAEYGDDPSSGSGWHYSRNPPQRYTVTEGGRRVRLAGGNVFPSKGEAQDAVRFLRATDGGEYRVRAIKPGEHVGRVAAVNGKKSAQARKKRGATGVRRAMRNGIPKVDDLTIDAVIALSKRTHYAADRKAYERAIEKLLARRESEGAGWWNPAGDEADDIDIAELVHDWKELTRAGGLRVGVETTRKGHRKLTVVRRLPNYKVAQVILFEDP